MEDDAEVARRQIRTLYLGFMVAAGVYVFLGIEMRTIEAEAQVTVQGLWLWFLRGLVATFSVAGLAMADRVLANRPLDPVSKQPGSFSPRVQRCFARAIARLAFAEAIGIYGLLLTLLFGHLVDVFAFGAASLAAMAATFPTSDRWAGKIAKTGGDPLA